MALATVVEVDSNIMQPINSRVYGHDEPNTPFSEMNKSIHLFCILLQNLSSAIMVSLTAEYSSLTFNVVHAHSY
jgi:hypothetical protein